MSTSTIVPRPNVFNTTFFDDLNVISDYNKVLKPICPTNLWNDPRTHRYKLCTFVSKCMD